MNKTRQKSAKSHIRQLLKLLFFISFFYGITNTQIVLEEVHPSLICVLGYPFILNINVHLVDNDRSDVFVFVCLFFWMQDPDFVEVTSRQGVLCPHSRSKPAQFNQDIVKCVFEQLHKTFLSWRHHMWRGFIKGMARVFNAILFFRWASWH